MKRYRIRFTFGTTSYVAYRHGKTGQDALNDVKQQCRIANKAYRKDKKFELIELQESQENPLAKLRDIV